MSVFVGNHESPAKTMRGAAGMVGEAIKKGVNDVAQKMGAYGVVDQVTTAAMAANHVITTGTAPPPAFGANFYTHNGEHVQFNSHSHH
jgi:hypothetical protein